MTFNKLHAHAGIHVILARSGLHGGEVKSVVSWSLDHLRAVSVVGSSPALATCRQAKFCLRVCQVVFLVVLPFSPTFSYLIIMS